MTKNELLYYLEQYLIADISGSFYTVLDAEKLLKECAKQLKRI